VIYPKLDVGALLLSSNSSRSRVPLLLTTNLYVVTPRLVFPSTLTPFQIYRIAWFSLSPSSNGTSLHARATERITLADIALAAEFQPTTVDATLRAKLPNVLRHFEAIVDQPNLASVFGSTAYAEKALRYTPHPKEEKKPATSAQPKAEKKPKKEVTMTTTSRCRRR